MSTCKDGRMCRVYILLGKYGDIFSILPILQREFDQSGERQILMVSRQYVQAVDRVPQVKPVIWEGDWQDLRGAVTLAKKQFPDVVVCQTFGKNFPIQHRLVSFQMDQWDRAGYLDKWDTLPLTLNRHKSGQELLKNLGFNGQRFILVADQSQSSQFPKVDELLESLTSFLMTRDEAVQVVKLSSIRAKHPLDLLSIYDAAKLIVTTETMHLHLSKATNTPVIALAADTPSRWHGSAWSKRFAFYAHYGEFRGRNNELLETVNLALGGKPSPARAHEISSESAKESRQFTSLEVKVIPTAKPHGYNPSIIKYKGELLTTYRWHNRSDWKTTINLIDGKGVDYAIEFDDQFKDGSIEDGRLFSVSGKLMLSYVVAMGMNGHFRCVVGYGELVNQSGWKILKHFQPNFGNNNLTSMQKNWLPFDYKGKLHFVYSTSPEQYVIQVSGDKVEEVFKSNGSEWPYGHIRGGCVTPYNGKLLRFFHSHTSSGPRDSWVYRIGVSLMNSDPPFATTRICHSPLLAGNEEWTQCKHWKGNVVFPAGVIPDGDGWLLACGVNDCESVMVSIKPENLNL